MPLLLRRILNEKNIHHVKIETPINAHSRDNIIKQDGLERFVKVALKREKCDALLVVLDSEGECPAELGVWLANRLRARFPHIPSAVALANRCYESWLLASVETISGKRDLAEFTEEIPDPESIPSPKRWLTDRMQGTRAYKETRDQVALTHFVDLHLVRNRSRSFRRLENALEQMLTSLQTRTVMITP